MRRLSATLLAALVLITSSTRLTAQTAVFLPGLGEGPGNWYLTDQAIAGSGIGVTPVYPAMPTGWTIPLQRGYLTDNFGWSLGGNSILIGHSVGGLVARHTSQAQSLRGTATIGSPNIGLPVGENSYDLIDYGLTWSWDLLVTLNDFLAGDEYWIFDNAIGWAYYQIVYLTGLYSEIESLTGLNSGVALELRMRAFLDDTLNESANVGAELANAQTSVAVVVSAENYKAGGPIRLFADAATSELWHDLGMTLGGGALWGIYEIGNPQTAQQEREILDLMVLADFFFLYEDVWCAGVSYPQPYHPWQLGWCQENDAFIGASYQTRPGAATTVFWPNAKAHMSETEEGSLVVEMLRLHFGIQ